MTVHQVTRRTEFSAHGTAVEVDRTVLADHCRCALRAGRLLRAPDRPALFVAPCSEAHDSVRDLFEAEWSRTRGDRDGLPLEEKLEYAGLLLSRCVRELDGPGEAKA